jgi:hypothetical protein
MGITKDREKSLDTAGSEAVRTLLNSELMILREIAEQSGSEERLFVVNFLEANEDNLFGVLAITIETSAAFAAADGLPERHWLQQLLNRHASDPEQVETLWPLLVNLWQNAWPWPKEAAVHNHAARESHFLFSLLNHH